MNRAEYFRRYLKRLRCRAKTMFSNRCARCFGKDNLEFAHKNKCWLGGGRGGKDRMRAVINNPNNFILLCHDCHVDYDKPYVLTHDGMIYTHKEENYTINTVAIS